MPGFGLGAGLAAFALASAFLVSYTRAKSEGLGFTQGTGMAEVGLAPREIRLVILSAGLILAGLAGGVGPTLSGGSRCGSPSPLGRSAFSARSRSSSASSTSGTRPSRAAGSRETARWRRPGRTEPTARTGPRPTAGAGRGDAATARSGSRSSASGNCASSLVQGRYYYENAKVGDFVPGSDARQPRRLPRPRHRVRGRVRHRQEQGRQGPVGGDLPEAEQHLRLPAGARTSASRSTGG